MLRDRIESGFYPPGCKLPKEVDLAAELNVARITLRPALELLEIENFIIRAKGIGTFVREKLDEKIRVMVVSSSPLDNSYRISNPFLYLMPYLQAAAMRMNIKIDICDAKSLLISDVAQCAARIRENGIRGIFLLDSGFAMAVNVPLAFRISRFTGVSIFWIYAACRCREMLKTVLGVWMLRKGQWIRNLAKQ
jgi:hypothetical protein